MKSNHLVEVENKPKKARKRTRSSTFIPTSSTGFTENDMVSADLGGADNDSDNDTGMETIQESIPEVQQIEKEERKKKRTVIRNIISEHMANDVQDMEKMLSEFSSIPNIDDNDREYLANLINQGESMNMGEFVFNTSEELDTSFIVDPKIDDFFLNNIKPGNFKRMGVAPEQITENATFGYGPGQTPFRNEDFLDFTINHYIFSNATDTDTDKILKKFHKRYFKTPHLHMPMNLDEIKQAVNHLPIMKPKNDSKDKKSTIYDISENIVRILNDPKTSSQMIWSFDSSRANKSMSELYHSPGFQKYYLQCLSEGTVPLVMILYYDDFRKFSKSAGSAGALYYTFANFNRNFISDTSNIYLGAMVHQDDDLWAVIDDIVNQLINLYKPQLVFNGSVKQFIPIRTFLGMFLGDTPQRADFTCFKRQNSACPCVHCDVEYLLQHTDEIGNKRTVKTSKEYFAQWHAGNRSRRKLLEELHCIKPSALVFKNQDRKTNPFWKLHILYGFDIHQDSVIDWFHVGILGIFKRHITYLDEQILTGKEKDRLKELTSHENYKIFGRKLPRYKVSNCLVFD